MDGAAVEGSSHGIGKMGLDYCGNFGRGFASSWGVVSGAAGAGWTGLRIVVDQGREGVGSCSWFGRAWG